MGRVKVRELDTLDRYRLRLSTVKAKPFRWKNKVYNNLVDEYTKKVGGRSYNAVEWFFTNVAYSIRKGGSAMSIKLDANYWSGNTAKIGYRKVVDVIKWMEDNGYITVFLGNKDLVDRWKSNPSIVRFEQKLKDLFDLENVKLYLPEEAVENTIVLRDRTKEKNIVEITPTKETKKMEQEVKEYNDSIKDISITFNDMEIPQLEYVRSFSGNLYSGGRLFANGGSVQLLPEKYRLEHLKIDGMSVVELDYKAIHPFILYENEAQKNDEIYNLAIDGFDPYGADESVVRVDEKEIARHKMKFGLTKYNPVRTLFKKSLMMLINNKDEVGARQSINHELYKDKTRDECDKLYVGLSGVDPALVMDALCEHNVLIEHHFYDDAGVALQYMDSKIALRVIDYLMQEGQTALAYHDSFAVKQGVEPLLEYAMKAAWKDILGTNEFCFIEKK